MYDYLRLKRIAEVEFPDIVVEAEIIRQRKLRIIIIDSSYIDIFYSPSSANRHFAYHWERVFLDGTFYRHDNIPMVSGKTLLLSLNISIIVNMKMFKRVTSAITRQKLCVIS